MLLPIALLLLAACTVGGHHSASTELPPECGAFVTKYESCLNASVPSLPNVAKQRSAQTREALQQEADRATAPLNLKALATKCHDNLQRLTANCDVSRTTN